MPFTVAATIVQTPRVDHLEVLEAQLVTVGDDGHILAIEPAAGASAEVTLPADSVLMPGLIDTHLHAPQWPQLGAGLDLPLDEWLLQHTFPLEARFADTNFARNVWDDMVPTLLAGGTTTAVYYSSIHEEATVALAEACHRHGQRAFVGRVAMDHPAGTPASYRDSSAVEGAAASRRSIEAILSLRPGSNLVQPIITPRFIPACTNELLSLLAGLAEETGVRVQSHCSESDWEHGHVLDRTGQSDAAALHRFGLIRDHTVLAHAGHISDQDRSLLIEAGAGVAHCPLSNSYFANAVFPAKRHLRAGLRMGLGTDVAGGPESSMLAQCAHAVTSSRMLEDGVDHTIDAAGRGVADSRLDLVAAFWLATAGGAELLGINAGLLSPGNVFDAIVVDLGPGSGARVQPGIDDWPRRFEKAVRRSGHTDITHVWVDGRLVSGG